MDHAPGEGRTRCVSGVYTIDAAQRQRLTAGDVAPGELRVTVLDGIVDSRDELFDELARAMKFPDYFGRNWDAVYDCLTDPSVFPAAGSVIVLGGWDRFASEHPDQWRIGLKVFNDACAFWRATGSPMFVLIAGMGGDASGIPVLPSGCLAGVIPGD